MYCSKCGKETPENSKFCPSCGVKIGFSDDSVSSGMQPFNVGNESQKSRESDINWGILLGFIFGNIGMFIATFFSTYGLLKACEQLSKEGRIENEDMWIAMLYLIIFIIPTAIWQIINNKILEWVDDLKENKAEDISIWTYFSIFIPVVPAVIRLYYSTQHENYSITMQNILFYILALLSCWVYYWIKQTD